MISVVIPAAGKPTNTILTNSSLSDTMIPINGKPIIAHIIDDLLRRSITSIVILVRSEDQMTARYIEHRYGQKAHIDIVTVKKNRGLGYSLLQARGHVPKTNHLLIYLADTIYKGPLEFRTDFLVTSTSVSDPSKWCFVEKKSSQLLRFIDKPSRYKKNGKALCGIYFLTDSSAFFSELAILTKKQSRVELSSALEQYQKQKPFRLHRAVQWYDCGNIENYYQAKIDFLNVRGFNSISYDSLLGIIKKSGNNQEKIKQEIKWYQQQPEGLRIFSPRLVAFEKQKKPYWYTLEYYGYQSLADLFVFNAIPEQIWKAVIDRLFIILDLFKKYHGAVPTRDYESMYVQKTIDRLSVLKENPYWKTLLAQSHIKINGKEYPSIVRILPKIRKRIRALARRSEMSFIHGDLCFSNILFDPYNRIFKFIDPRGAFGTSKGYGDIKYDIAKLRHSVCNKYDFITSNLFTVQQNRDREFTFTVHNDQYHNDIGSYFDQQLVAHKYSLRDIQLIEALLFISMIPLHNDNFERQQAMFCIGTQLLAQAL